MLDVCNCNVMTGASHFEVVLKIVNSCGYIGSRIIIIAP